MSLLTRPPHGTYFIPRWSPELLFTVMLDVSTALKENNEKVCPFFFFEVVSILTARNGPNQTVFIKSKMEGAVVGVGLSVSQNQQQDCITESIVTL